MTRWTPSWTTLAVVALVTVGCSHATPFEVAPSAATPSQSPRLPGATYAPGGAALLGGTVVDRDAQQAALAIYTLQLDPATLQASLTPQVVRQGQENDDLYELPLDNLVSPGSFTVLEVKADADSVDVTWQFTHPFKAPADVTAPATAANRADLGISGRVAFLAEVSSATGNTFFQDTPGDLTVILNPSLLQNPDGFVKPAGLLALSGFTANTFPYQALVDERNNGNRIGISNDADVRGNYDAGNGWQREDFGATNDGFTGYGILHQGQAVTRTIRFSLAALQTGQTIALDVAILAKYVDPRGGATLPEKKANRLPGAAADVTKFCYREPHGSLDIEAFRFQGQVGNIAANSGDSAELRFTVVDWDARATETAQANLATEITTSRVNIGASGAPAIGVCIPGVIGDPTGVTVWPSNALKDDDTPIGGDAGQDTGRPGDGLYYSNNIVNFVTGQTRGIYYGVARAVDPEDASSFPTPRLYLDANLAPLSTNLPRVRIYQAFPVTIGNNAPVLAAAMVSGAVLSGTKPQIV
ncbi:MAG: hypothetical protein ABI743_04610, partial [bacterium]